MAEQSKMSLLTKFFVFGLQLFDFSMRLLMKTLATQILILIFKSDVPFLHSVMQSNSQRQSQNKKQHFCFFHTGIHMEIP
jgi:hypothetical protein